MINSSFDTKTGRITFAFDDGGSVSTAQILSVGSLNYDYDQTPDSTTIDRTMAVYSFIQVSMMQYDDIGEDLWERLTTATLVQEVAVLMNIATWDNESYDFPMKIRITDISLNERDRSITLRLLPNTNLTVTAGEVFDEIPLANKVSFSRIPEGETVATNYVRKANSVKDWISYALNLVFNNTMENEIASAPSNLPINYTPYIFGDLPTNTNQRGLFMLDMRAPDFGADIGASETIIGVGTLTTDGILLANGVPINNEFPDGLSNTDIYVIITISGGDTSQFRLGDQLVINGSVYGQTLGVIEIVNSTTIHYATVFGQAFSGEAFSMQRPQTPQYIPAIQTLKSLAGVEGAVFGTGFGKNFYFNRINRTDSDVVTIDYDLVMEMKPTVFYLSLGNSLVRQIATSQRRGTELYGQWNTIGGSGSRVPNLNDFTSVTAGNRNASKELKIEIAPAYPFLVKGEVTVFGAVNGDYDNIETDNQLESSMTATGLKAYFQALNNIDGDISIEFTVMEAVSIKPWELIQFASDAPEKYRNRQFRPTSVKYDFINDTVTVKAYQVDSIVTPVLPDDYVRTGLSFQFGKSLSTIGMQTAINNQVANGLRLVASFVLANEARGLIETLLIDRGDDTTTIIPANYFVTLINPFNVQQKFEVTVAQDMLATDTSIIILPTLLDTPFPAGSYVYVSTQSILTSVSQSEFQWRVQSQNRAVGALTQASSGTVTTLAVNLFAAIRIGEDFDVANVLTGQNFPITSTGDYNAGIHTINIQEAIVDAPAGALINGDGGMKQAEMVVSPGGIILAVTREKQANAIAVLNQDIAQGTTGLAFILVRDVAVFTGFTDPIQLFNGEFIQIQNRAGQKQLVIIDGDQELVSATSQINILSALTFTEAYENGSAIWEPAGFQTARITVNSAEIDLRVEKDGIIASINISPEVIRISANRIEIDGTTTFSAGYDPADGRTVFRQTETPAVRPSGDALVDGDEWFKTDDGNRLRVWNSAGSGSWALTETTIEGSRLVAGSVTADRIDVADLFAQEITVTGGIQNADGDYLLNASGFAMNGDLGSELSSAGISWRAEVDEQPGGVVLSSIQYYSGTLVIYSTNGIALVTGGGSSEVVISGILRANNSIRIYNDSSPSRYASIDFANDTTNRTLTIPILGGNRTFSFIDQNETLTGTKTTTYNNLLLRNNAGTRSATLRFNGASNRTINLPNASGEVLVSESVSAGTITPDRYIQITLGTTVYYIPAELVP